MRKELTDLRAPLTAFAYPVAVITVRDGEEQNGMTAAWVTQVSIDPKIFAVSIGLTRYTHELMERSPSFGINLLSDDLGDLSNLFGKGSGRKTDRFKDPRVKLYEAKSIDCPMLEGCVLNVECKRSGSHIYGDHTIFVGEATRIEFDDEKRPLIYRGLKYYSMGNFLLDR